jgi:DNA repair protein RadC
MNTGVYRARVEEQRAVYGLTDDEALVQHALAVVGKRLKKMGACVSSPQMVKDFLRLSFAGQEYESFVVLFIDVKNRVLEVKELFRGTLTHTSVYPREVLKEGLALNASGVIVAHNHPSGEAEPSDADKLLTRSLTSALALVDIRVLDHIVVAGLQSYSFAEHGLI